MYLFTCIILTANIILHALQVITDSKSFLVNNII